MRRSRFSARFQTDVQSVICPTVTDASHLPMTAADPVPDSAAVSAAAAQERGPDRAISDPGNSAVADGRKVRIYSDEFDWENENRDGRSPFDGFSDPDALSVGFAWAIYRAYRPRRQ